MRFSWAIGAGLAAALSLGTALPSSYGAEHTQRASLPEAASGRAGQALAQARDLFEARDPVAARRTVGAGRDATLALRDLVRVRSQLRGTAAREADRLLARPAARRTRCAVRFCVHWNPATASPTYIDQVVATVTDVHRQYVDAGYRPPRPDGGRGGNNKTDIYIRDVGALGLYGYCTTDKRIRAREPSDAWAYCVLDNDYRPGQFPALTRLDNLRVTAAHEYFHAVQFAYDAFEDAWFMEATATWAEDEVYPDINDNVQYLRHGPLGRPGVPLDRFALGGLHQYGVWVFFRYLAEQFPSPAGMSPLVRQMWQRADGSAGGPDLYSLRAVRATLAARGESLARQFARFADANRRPDVEYADGGLYPTAPPGGTRRLEAGQTSGWISRDLDHLSSTTLRFTPTGSSPRALRVQLDMAAPRRGSLAVVTAYAGALPLTSTLVRPDRLGHETVTVAMNGGGVSRIEVTLVNASTRTRCGRSLISPYSCFGSPRDDNLTQRVRVVAVP